MMVKNTCGKNHYLFSDILMTFFNVHIVDNQLFNDSKGQIKYPSEVGLRQ